MKKISNHTLGSFLIACFCVFSSFVIAAEPTYKFVDLGLQESDCSEAVAVNDNGQVAGTYWFLGNKYYFLWDAESGIELIDLPKTSTIKVLNNSRQIAGEYGHRRGFFWDPVQGFIDLGTLGGKYTTVEDMNDLGQIVGCSDTGCLSHIDCQSPAEHAYLWQNGSITDLGTLAGDLGLYGDGSTAVGINNAGEIIGKANCALVHKGKLMRSEQKAVIWKNNIIEEFDPSFGGTTELLSINSIGMITCGRHDKGGVWHCVFNKAKITKLGSNIRSKINDNGSVLVFPSWLCLRNDTKFEYQWNDLKNIFSQSAPFPWKEFGQAYDFNNNNWIVGSARNVYGEYQAILLRPTE